MLHRNLRPAINPQPQQLAPTSPVGSAAAPQHSAAQSLPRRSERLRPTAVVIPNRSAPETNPQPGPRRSERLRPAVTSSPRTPGAQALITTDITSADPVTLNEALRRDDAKQWEEAMQSEYK